MGVIAKYLNIGLNKVKAIIAKYFKNQEIQLKPDLSDFFDNYCSSWNLRNQATLSLKERAA